MALLQTHANAIGHVMHGNNISYAFIFITDQKYPILYFNRTYLIPDSLFICLHFNDKTDSLHKHLMLQRFAYVKSESPTYITNETKLLSKIIC